MGSLEAIADKEYLGRLIIIGRIGDNDVISYAVTGRSPPSQARTLEHDEENQTIYTEPTDPKTLQEGSPVLLLYPAIIAAPDGRIAVSNGYQTNLISTALRNYLYEDSAHKILAEALTDSFFVYDKKLGFVDVTSYEPDKPNFTPRISGVVTKDSAAMSIARRVDGSATKEYFEVPLSDGFGKAIATYTGQNVPKGETIPSFKGEPFIVKLEGGTPEEVTEAVYRALGPKEEGSGIISPGADFRVGVATIFYNRKTGALTQWIKNRHERGK